MQQQLKIDLAQTSGHKCVQCQSSFFEQSLLLRKFSRFLSGMPEDVYIPVQVINCKQCGLLAKEALDPQLRAMLNLNEEVEVEEEPPVSNTPVISISN